MALRGRRVDPNKSPQNVTLKYRPKITSPEEMKRTWIVDILAASHLVPNTFSPRTFGPPQLVPKNKQSRLIWSPRQLVPLDNWSPNIWSPWTNGPQDNWSPRTNGPQTFGPHGQMVPPKIGPHGQLVPKIY